MKADTNPLHRVVRNVLKRIEIIHKNIEIKRHAAQWPSTFGAYHDDYTYALDAGRTHAQALDLADTCAEASARYGHRVTARFVIGSLELFHKVEK